MSGSSRVRTGVAAAVAAGLVAAAALGAAPPPRTLRVCADPNNMPFSDHAGDGLENRIATLFASDLHAQVEYTWWAERRGFVRNTLNAKRCDVVLGIIAGDEQVLTTGAYYRSTYVFVSRRDRDYDLSSMNDPRLHRLRIGIHVIGDDYNSLPPGVALAGRGIIRNVVGYSIYGNYATASPPSQLIAAVARDDVDVAIAWGPLAGYFAARSPVPLAVTPIRTTDAGHGIPFSYPIAIGVRRGDTARCVTMQHELDRHRAAIARILRSYHVPLAPDARADAPSHQGDSCGTH